LDEENGWIIGGEYEREVWWFEGDMEG